MELKSRMTQIHCVQDARLIVGDLNGQLHLLGEDLRPLKSSPVLAGGAPLRALAAADGLIVGKDRRGGLAVWSLATLELLCRVEARAICADAGSEGLEAGRGLHIWRGRVYTSDGAGGLVVLEPATLAVERVIPKFLGGAAVDAFCTDHAEVHAVVDQDGRLHLGSLATMEFQPAASADPGLAGGRVRAIRFDPYSGQFHTLWADCPDGGTGIGNGVVTLGLDGAVKQQTLFSRYELDLLEASPDSTRLYAMGREGLLYMLDNSCGTPRVAKTITGFPHESADLAVGEGGSVYVLLLSNELVRLDAAGEYVDGFAPARRQGIWDVQADLIQPNRLYCATDEGVAVVDVEYGATGGPVLRPAEHHRTAFGMTRRLVAVPDGYLGLAHDEMVFRSYGDGKTVWSTRIDDRGQGLAVSPGHDRALVACGIGGIELDAATGRQLSYLSVDGVPLWSAVYGPAGERILGNGDGTIAAFAPDSAEELWRVDLGSVAHRLWCADGRLYAAGTAGLTEIDLDGRRPPRTFEGPGPCEAAVIEGESVYLAAHDGRLLEYDLPTARYRGDARPLPDLVRTLALLRDPDGSGFLVAGGRGGYLCVYALSSGNRPAWLRETYLARAGGRSFRLETVVERDLLANCVASGTSRA